MPSGLFKFAVSTVFAVAASAFAHPGMPAGHPEVAHPNRTLFELITADIAVHRGDTGFAYEAWMDAAKNEKSADLAKLAWEAAVATRNPEKAIAAAKGIDMQKVDAVSGKGCAVKPSARYSTLQDLDAGRHTEIDMFSGTLIRMGKELGIPTPYNEFTYHMIKALEEKNDGKFDYTGPNQEMTWAR